MAQATAAPVVVGSPAYSAQSSNAAPSRWRLHVGIWTLLGLSFAAQNYLSAMALGNTVPLSRALRSAFSDWYVLAVLFYATQRVCRRFPLERPLLARHVAFHILFGALFSL